MVGANTEVVLGRLVDALGETANLAVLTGSHAEYVAQVPSRHRMRMFTEVGRQVDLHCAGVGKALLGQLEDDRVQEIVRRVGLSRHTRHTLVTEHDLLADLARVRSRGYALDEQEVGVRCVAVPVGPEPTSWMAVSVSGPVTRMTDELVGRAVPLLHEAAVELRQITEPSGWVTWQGTARRSPLGSGVRTDGVRPRRVSQPWSVPTITATSFA